MRKLNRRQLRAILNEEIKNSILAEGTVGFLICCKGHLERILKPGATFEEIKNEIDSIIDDEYDGDVGKVGNEIFGLAKDADMLISALGFMIPKNPSIKPDMIPNILKHLKSRGLDQIKVKGEEKDALTQLKEAIENIIVKVQKMRPQSALAKQKASELTRLSESRHRRTMRRKQLRTLIESLLFENFDVGEEIQTKDMTKDTPYVRSQKTYAFHDPGPSIALTGNNTFHDGAMSAGLIYQALSYGLNVEGEDLAEAGITQDDLAEIIKLNKNYKACYGTGDSMEFKRADIDMLPKSVLPKALAVYKFSKKLSEENPNTSRELFSKEALVSLGKRLISGDQSSKINVGAMRTKNKEYKKMKSEEKSSQ